MARLWRHSGHTKTVNDEPSTRRWETGDRGETAVERERNEQGGSVREEGPRGRQWRSSRQQLQIIQSHAPVLRLVCALARRAVELSHPGARGARHRGARRRGDSDGGAASRGASVRGLCPGLLHLGAGRCKQGGSFHLSVGVASQDERWYAYRGRRWATDYGANLAVSPSRGSAGGWPSSR